MDNQLSERCPRCGVERLRSWGELDEEEQMIVRRLPGAAEYAQNERETLFRWCTRCWYEERQGARHDA